MTARVCSSQTVKQVTPCLKILRVIQAASNRHWLVMSDSKVQWRRLTVPQDLAEPPLVLWQDFDPSFSADSQHASWSTSIAPHSETKSLPFACMTPQGDVCLAQDVGSPCNGEARQKERPEANEAKRTRRKAQNRASYVQSVDSIASNWAGLLTLWNRQQAFRERKAAYLRSLEGKISDLTSTVSSLNSEKQHLEEALQEAQHETILLRAWVRPSPASPTRGSKIALRPRLSKRSPECRNYDMQDKPRDLTNRSFPVHADSESPTRSSICCQSLPSSVLIISDARRLQAGYLCATININETVDGAN